MGETVSPDGVQFFVTLELSRNCSPGRFQKGSPSETPTAGSQQDIPGGNLPRGQQSLPWRHHCLSFPEAEACLVGEQTVAVSFWTSRSSSGVQVAVST